MDPLDMLLDGWCEDCDGDPAECINLGRCKGEKDENTCGDT
jgi:hypothetical protein